MRKQLNDLILSASSIKGTSVRTPGDEEIGKIKDIMINTGLGNIAYAVLEVDSGFLNLGSKYFAIPWQALAIDSENEEMIIFDVDKEKLEKSPGFDKDNWPTGPQYDFINELHSYYGYKYERNIL